MSLLPPLRLTGATILRDGEMQRRSVALAEGLLTTGPLPEVDLSGYFVMPGIIDLHGEGFERHIAPRPTAPFPLVFGLLSAEREAAANGITTAFFAQGWSWEGGPRSPARAFALAEALTEARSGMTTDIRLQIRCETHLVEAGAELLALIERHGIGYVVFNNHLDQAQEMRRADLAGFAHWAQALGRTPEEHLVAVETARAREREVPRHLCRLAEAFDRLGVVYGSHDDPDGETRERFSMIGARVAEFPVSRKAAAAAKAMMNPVVMGAPNVVRGGSASGNVAAVDLIRQGLCDALVSDYHAPALAEAAWALVDLGILTLPRAWALISEGPAEILRMPDRGALSPGKRADLAVVNVETRAIEAVIAGGRLSYLAGEAGRRFLRQPIALGMAAE